MARDRPAPYGNIGSVPHIVARGPVPRDRATGAETLARDRPAPYGVRPTSVVRERLLPIGSGSGDPDLQGEMRFAGIQTHGAGQARALRCKGARPSRMHPTEQSVPLPEDGSRRATYRDLSVHRWCCAIQSSRSHRAHCEFQSMQIQVACWHSNFPG